MVAYNERILATSQSAPRRERAERMLVNLQPEIARLEREEATRLTKIAAAAPPASSLDGQLQRLRDRRADTTSGLTASIEFEKPKVVEDETDLDEDETIAADDDTDDGDDETEPDPPEEAFAAPAPVTATRRGRPPKDPAVRLTDRRFRQVDERKWQNEVKPAWWVAAGTDRSTFAAAAAKRAKELETDPNAAKMKTKLNFVD